MKSIPTNQTPTRRGPATGRERVNHVRHSMATLGSLAGLFVTTAMCAGAAVGPVWEEGSETGSEAGSTPTSAERTTGSGEVGRIRGELSSSDDGLTPDLEDMYLIRICDLDAFFASTGPKLGGVATFDTRLWLFEADPIFLKNAFGSVANDNIPGQPTNASLIDSMPTDGSPPIMSPGLFYLAISGTARDPRSTPGQTGAIFVFDDPMEISGPDGPGAMAPITGWETIGPPPGVGMYEIVLQGVTFGSTFEVDCNRNGLVDSCDILLGTSSDQNDNGVPDECEPVEDIDRDGDVDFADVLQLIAMWGDCPPFPTHCAADFNHNGQVEFGDLLLLIGAWTGSNP